MRRLLLGILLCTATTALAGEAPTMTWEQFETRFASFALMSNAQQRDADFEQFWAELEQAGRIPFVDGERVAFLYRGRANSVAFAGDFNGWDPKRSPARQMIGTDTWWFETTFPRDARLDYKLVIDDGRWILDPANPAIQRSGFGDNSELRMPGYEHSPWCDRREDVPRGAMIDGFLASEILRYPVNYQVYTPVGYDDLEGLPVLYVTDGHEYADDRMGSLCATLDNLIHAGKLRPLIAVFIDPRIYGQNRRSEQYILSDVFAQFVATELVPAIDAQWKTSADRRDRGILGTSLGGLNSAFFGLRHPDVFHRILIQSPAFQAGDGRIVDYYREAPRLDLDLFMTWGTFHDFGPTTVEFQRILDEKGYEYRHRLVNEGHSWGNWRNLLPEMLLAMWPAE